MSPWKLFSKFQEANVWDALHDLVCIYVCNIYSRCLQIYIFKIII